MSLTPAGDTAAEAFDRLRSEVSLLRRAVEGLASDPNREPIDYSPTLAALAESLTTIESAARSLGERPLLALTPEQLRTSLDREVSRVVAAPISELKTDRAEFQRAIDAFSARRAVPHRARGGAVRAAGLGVAASLFVVAVLLGPIARRLPTSWGVPERLAEHLTGVPRQHLELARDAPEETVQRVAACLRRAEGSSATTRCVLQIPGLADGKSPDVQR